MLWYIISFFCLISVCYYNDRYNDESIRKKKYHRRHGFDEKVTEKQKNRIKWFIKADIEQGGWTFLMIKVLTAILLEAVMIGIALMCQFSDFEDYIENERMFFMGVFIDTLVVTIAGGYYSIIIDAASGVKGIKNKVHAILNVFEGTLIKKIFWHLVSLVLLGYAVEYSFNEFSWYAPIGLGILYVIFLAIPVKDASVRR